MDRFGTSATADRHKGKNKRTHERDPKQVSDKLGADLQELVCSLPHDATGHVARKLSLCLGMPVMIKQNIATECCVTNGAEATVMGWKYSLLSGNKRVLDVVCVKLVSPPTPIQLDGLPVNVVPIAHMAVDIQFQLQNDDTLNLVRQQVQILPNFAMTDYGSQGHT